MNNVSVINKNTPAKFSPKPGDIFESPATRRKYILTCVENADHNQFYSVNDLSTGLALFVVQPTAEAAVKGLIFVGRNVDLKITVKE